MTYSDGFNLRTTSVKFSDVADAIDGTLQRVYVPSTTGTSTSYLVNPSPKWTGYSDFPVIAVIPHVSNTAGAPSVTLNVSGLGALPIKIAGGDIPPNTLVAGTPIVFCYNGTHFEPVVSESTIRPDGTNIVTGNLNIAGFKIGSVGAATTRTDAVQVEQVVSNSATWLGTTTASATDSFANATPPLSAFVAGQSLSMIVGATSGLSFTSFPVSYGLYVDGVGGLVIEPEETTYSLYRGSMVQGAIVDLVATDVDLLKITNTPNGWIDHPVSTTNFTGVSPNVVSSVTTVEVSRFIKIGKQVTWEIGIAFNLGTGGGPYLNLVVPVRASASITSSKCIFIGAYASDSAAATIPCFFFPSSGTLRIQRNVLSAQNWASSATCYIRGVITYEAE